jgi:hypothetical protein
MTTIPFPLEHKTEIEKGNLEYLSPKCSCGWTGGCWASYENALREVREHELFVKQALYLYGNK